MTLPQHFEAFHTRLTIDAERQARAKAAHERLREIVSNDHEIRPLLHEAFLQGSYRHGTQVRPLADRDEFDVDVCLAMDVDRRPDGQRGPGAVVGWLAARLGNSPAYVGKVERRPRCVRVRFAGDFYMDVVPLHAKHATATLHFVPNRVAQEWSKTSPKPLAEWYRAQNARTDGRFTRAAKMIKEWRNNVVDKASRPSSVALEVLVAAFLPDGAASDAQAVVLALEGMSRDLGRHSTVPTLTNPTLADENLLRDWTTAGFLTFRRALELAAAKAARANLEADRATSIRLWREVLGDRFPAST